MASNHSRSPSATSLLLTSEELSVTFSLARSLRECKGKHLFHSTKCFLLFLNPFFSKLIYRKNTANKLLKNSLVTTPHSLRERKDRHLFSTTKFIFRKIPPTTPKTTPVMLYKTFKNLYTPRFS